MFGIKTVAAIAVAAALSASAASALTAEINSISGLWTNVTPEAGEAWVNDLNGVGTDTISWGDPATWGGQQSSYIFDAIATPSTVDDNPFFVGTLTHKNYAIYGPTIGTATLSVSIGGSMDHDGETLAFTLTSDFLFEHDETVNYPGGWTPCPAGDSAPCADIVNFAGVTGSTSVTFSDGTTYLLEFSNWAQKIADSSTTGRHKWHGGYCGSGSDECTTWDDDAPWTIVDQFVSDEDCDNMAALFVSITEVPNQAPPVPLPATGLLLIGAFGGLAAVRRRKA